MEFTEEEWVYAGVREGADGKPYDAYAAVHGGVVTEPRLWKALRFKRPVGGRYRVQVLEGGTKARIASAVYAGQLGDHEQVDHWRVESDVAQVRIRNRRLEMRARKGTVDLSGLDPLRAAYRKGDYVDRAAIEMLVLQYLRRVP